MIVYNERGEIIEDFDLDAGYLELKSKKVEHRWEVDSEEQGEWVTINKYPETGGKDVEWRVTAEEQGHWRTTDADGEEVADFDGTLSDDWPHDVPVPDVFEYAIYHPYTEEELEEREKQRQEAEAEEETLRQRRMAVPMLLSAFAESMDDDELASVALALPEWGPGVKYKRGAACQHEGVAYRVVANVSKNNDAEPGTPEGADYYAPVDVGPSGVQAWEPDKSYMKGERVEHGGRVWESLKNNNREEPGTRDRWSEVADGAD